MLNIIYVYFSGLLMGIADTMPGISGSTITYILGVYEELINSLSNLFKKNYFVKSFSFLLKIGLGWLTGAIISILVISNSVDNNIYFITSLFLGLVISSIPITFLTIGGSFKIKKNKIIYAFLGFLLVILIFIFGNSINQSIDINNNILMSIYIFVVAMVAISSMLLPGISGSTILLIFGLYYPLILNLEQLLKGNFQNIYYIVVFGLGVIVGLFTVAKLISKLFQKHKENTMYFIQGLLIGSLLPIISAPTTIKDANYNALSFKTFEILPFIIGIAVLILLNEIRKKFR